MALRLTAHIVTLFLVAASFGCGSASNSRDSGWAKDWPRTDFTQHIVPLSEIVSVVDKNAIPAIDSPRFMAVAEMANLADTEPVIGLIINGEARAYPLQVMTWHEIANDVVGGVPVAVTFCPLCNAAVVFDRRVEGRTLNFGVSGKLRNSDLIMYDRQTQSWWQQFTGEAIVGKMTGAELKVLPARLESFALFRERAPGGKVLVPYDKRARRYGRNPYPDYDRSRNPFLYSGDMPRGVAPLARVVTIGDRAWSLDLVRERGRIDTPDGLIITWQSGQNSALGASKIERAHDVGNVLVQRQSEHGVEDVPYGVDFAFAFHAFNPESEIVTK